jgi:hypothetical protein
MARPDTIRAAGGSRPAFLALAGAGLGRALAAWLALGRALGLVHGAILLTLVYAVVFLPSALLRRAHRREREPAGGASRWQAREHAFGPADFVHPY